MVVKTYGISFISSGCSGSTREEKCTLPAALDVIL